jgi:arsenite methyltransferase
MQFHHLKRRQFKTPLDGTVAACLRAARAAASDIRSCSNLDHEMNGAPSEANSAATSAGHAMSLAGWVDAHYLACQPEYEAMVRSVGLQAGWHILDAGSGTGQFASVIAELVGVRGRISAIDIAPENIAIVQAQAASGVFQCSVDARRADVRALPFADQTFDAVWSANVMQYLNQCELAEALAEFSRVLKPGGVLAVKDGDITALQVFPIPPTMLWRLLDAWTRRGDQQIQGLLGSLALLRHVHRAGFASVSRRVTFMERTVPLRPPEAQFVGGLVEFFCGLAPTLDLSPADIEFWRRVGDPQSDHFILNEPDLYLREAAVLVVGLKR